MNRNRSLARGVIFLTILCWFTPSPTAQPLTSLSATAASYIERGNAWAAKGEWERALTDYDLAIATDPSAAGSYYNRGVARWRLKDYERARADFTRALQLKPHDSQAYAERFRAPLSIRPTASAILNSCCDFSFSLRSEFISPSRNLKLS